MVSLTVCTLGLATGTGAEVGAWATAVPCVVLEGVVLEGVGAAVPELLPPLMSWALAAPSPGRLHQLLSRPSARAPTASARASEIMTIRFLVSRVLLFI